MISGLASATLALCLAPAGRPMIAAETDALLASLARDPPQTIAFRETHSSVLLRRDITVAGVLEYPARGRLSRVVTEPYQERMDVEGGEVLIRRAGRPDRRLALRRNRDLGGLLEIFSGLLAGDRAALVRQYELAAFQLPDGWRITLAPRGREAAARAARVDVHGADGTPRSVQIVTQDGVAAEILLGDEAARSATQSGGGASCNGPSIEQ